MPENARMPQITYDTIHAAGLANSIELNASVLSPEWNQAVPVTFSADWQGRNHDPDRQTSVRVLWTPALIYFRLTCRYQELFTFNESDANGRRDHLWDRDVAEVFLQPDPELGHYYKEFEVSPNGMWIDLDIFPSGRGDLKSGLERSVWLDHSAHTWTAELAIPIKAITPHFDSSAEWRVNFYRVEGRAEPRFYSAWQSTKTPQPNFHVPSAFGRMRFK